MLLVKKGFEVTKEKDLAGFLRDKTGRLLTRKISHSLWMGGLTALDVRR